MNKKTDWNYAFRLLADEFRALSRAVLEDAEKADRTPPRQARQDYVERKIVACRKKA